MKGTVVLLVLLHVIFTTALEYEPGCEVSSSWQIPEATNLNIPRWRWRHVLITAWVDEEEPPHHPILDITLKFKDLHIAVARTDITINDGRFLAKLKSPDGNRNMTGNFTALSTGWQDFKLSITSVFTVTSDSLQGNTTVLQIPLDKKLEYIKVKGSNLTLQCENSYPVWRVDNDDIITVPLLMNQDTHHFAVYSTEGSLPVFVIQDKKLKLGWSSDNKTTSVDVEDPLPPHVYHNFTLTCQNQSATFKCILNDDSIIVPERPNHILVKSEDGKPFYLTLYNRVNTKREESTSKGNGGINIGLSVFYTILITLLIFIIVYLKVQRNRRTKAKNANINSPETQKFITNEEYDKVDLAEDNMEQKLKSLWEAVRSMRQQDVESLIAGEYNGSLINKAPNGKSTTILQEAHLRGDSEILKALSLPGNHPQRDHGFIKSIARIYAERVNLIFTSCKRGHYSGPGGVDELLIKFWLPGSIQDSSGLSLLHCAVSAKVIPSGEPLWELDDVESLVKDHQCNVNARNFLGETALHTLVTSIEENHGAKQTAVSEAWLQLAQRLLELGCNPALADYSNKTPVQYVNQNSSLRELLSQISQSNSQAWSASQIKFIINASRKGENQIITMITQRGMPYFGPNLSPMQQAMYNNNRDTVILLQSSGLPLLSSTTEITLKNLEGPTIFIALVEMEICNNLQEEMRKISKGNKLYRELLSHMQAIQQQVNNAGIGSILSPSPNDDYNSRYKDHVLVQAASLGLTYTCRLLQLLSNYTNFYHSETFKPVQEALKNKHIHTATVLCVDLQMYYSIDSLDNYKQFQSSLLSIEISLFKQILRNDENISEGDEKDMVEYLETLKDIGEPESPDNRLIHIITKSGLITLLHYIQTTTRFDLNIITNNHINSTILHVAIIYERVNIIEYIAYMKADFQMYMLEDLSAWTLSKIVENVSCQNAIRQHIEKSQISVSDLSEDALNNLKNRLECAIENISSEQSHEDYEFVKEFLGFLIEKIDKSIKHIIP